MLAEFAYGWPRSLVVKALGHAGVKALVRSALFEVDNRELERPPQEILHRYDNPQIGDYAKPSGLTDEQFSQPRFTTPFEYFKDNPANVLDIGCASGDFSIRLAKVLPNTQQYGLDFNVDYAKQNEVENTSFIAGYWADVAWPKCNALVTISTATCFLPRELNKLFQVASENGIRTIVLSEPWWWSQKRTDQARSSHAKYVCWNHNYSGYLASNGYTVKINDYTEEKKGVGRVFIVAELT